MSFILSTSLYRLADGLLLCTASDRKGPTSIDAQEAEAKVFQHLRLQHLGGTLQRHTFLEGGEASFFVLNDSDIAYVSCCAQGVAREGVHSFLEDIRREFRESYTWEQINSASHQYALINFDKNIHRQVRKFDATGGNPQMAALKKELAEVTNIMKQNLEDVIGRGEKLDSLHSQTDRLRHESTRFYGKTQTLSRRLLFRKYAPTVGAALTVAAIVWWKLGFTFFFFL